MQPKKERPRREKFRRFFPPLVTRLVGQLKINSPVYISANFKGTLTWEVYRTKLSLFIASLSIPMYICFFMKISSLYYLQNIWFKKSLPSVLRNTPWRYQHAGIAFVQTVKENIHQRKNFRDFGKQLDKQLTLQLLL